MSGANSLKRVFVIGFQNSSPKSMRRYLDLYAKNGYEVKTHYPPYLKNYDIREIQPLSLSIYRELLEWTNHCSFRKVPLSSDHTGTTSNGANPIDAIHCFSGGCFPLSHILSYAQLDGVADQITKKLIFDSGPLVVSEENMVNAFYEQTGKRFPLSLIRYGLKLYSISRYLHLPTYNENFEYVYGAKGLAKVPTLFMYSSADKVCRSMDVEHFAKIRSSHDNPFVFLKDFVDTEHARHILKDPEEYEKSLFDFLEAEFQYGIEPERLMMQNPTDTEGVKIEDKEGVNTYYSSAAQAASAAGAL
eukprot:Nk52_evm1s119 gene=Nk52_evmTU1s119